MLSPITASRVTAARVCEATIPMAAIQQRELAHRNNQSAQRIRRFIGVPPGRSAHSGAYPADKWKLDTSLGNVNETVPARIDFRLLESPPRVLFHEGQSVAGQLLFTLVHLAPDFGRGCQLRQGQAKGFDHHPTVVAGLL